MKQNNSCNGQKGFTLVELMIVMVILSVILVGIVTFVVYVVIGKTAVSYAESQTVSDIAAIKWLEEQGLKEVRLIETYRVNPQKYGCTSADDAGFSYSGSYISEGEIQGKTVTGYLCCVGSVGEAPRCAFANM